MNDPTITFDLPPMPEPAMAPAMPPGNVPPPQRAGMMQPGMMQPGMMQGHVPIVGDTGEIIAPNPKPGDEKLFVVFHSKSILDGAKTREEGRPIYRDVDYVRIHIPGDKFTVIDRKVTDEDRSRFYQRYAHYKATHLNAGPEGMPLVEWTGVTRAQAEELKHFNVLTVEQLATLPDQFGQRFMGFFDLRRKAKAYLEAAKDDAFAAKVAVENDELRAQLAKQQQDSAALAARLAALEQAQAQAKEPNVHDAVAGRAGRK